MPENPDNLLEIRGLRVRFRTEEGWVEAVKGIDFDIKRGETLGIVGESGSGKSVTSLSIMRLIASPPGEIAAGEMRFASPSLGAVDLRQLPNEKMRHIRGKEISMIFQEPMTSLNPVYTCGFQVAESLILHEKLSKEEARRRTIELFKKVRLPRPEAIYDAYPHQISGGQKQRVMIAMALACNPQVLIADEPTTALDVTVQKAILELMQELQTEYGMAIIFITHDLGVVAELADRVLVMFRGDIVEQGPVVDIFENAQHPYTQGLLACRPPLEQRLERLPTVKDFLGTDDAKAEGLTMKDAVERVVITPAQYRARLEELQKRPPILEVEGLKKYYYSTKGLFSSQTQVVKAVDDLSFQVYEGETLGLVGESGCGKTTLGRTLLRLQEPTEGSIKFRGKEITGLSESEMRKLRKDMQIIFQDPYSSLNPRLTVGSAITEPMAVHGLHGSARQRKEKAIALLDRVGLGAEHYHRYPHEFSGGQRQRICIARSLALEPQFIICDESVSALDVSVQAQVLNLLIELRRDFGFTYIFISHDLSVVKFMSDRMMVMNQGQIEEIGPAEDIYANPEKEYTRKLIDAIPQGRPEDIRAAAAKREASRKKADI